MAYQDPGAYNLMYGKVFSAMPTCPVMTISGELTSQDQDEDLEAKTKRDGRTFKRALPGGPVKMKTSPVIQHNCSGGLILILMIPTLGP